MKMKVTAGFTISKNDEWTLISTVIYDVQIVVVNGVLAALFQDMNKRAFKTAAAPAINSWTGIGSKAEPYPDFMKKHLGPRWERARTITREEMKKELHKLLMHRAMRFMDAQLTREDEYND